MVTDVSGADWEALGLEPGADIETVHDAYRRRRALYDRDSLATYNLMLDHERVAILERLDVAYQRIIEAGRTAQPVTAVSARPEATDADPPLGPAPDPAESPGAYLEYRRRTRGIALAEVAAETKIRPVILEWIENEAFARLPTSVYVRGFVIQIARFLGLPDQEGLATYYLTRMEQDRRARHDRT